MRITRLECAAQEDLVFQSVILSGYRLPDGLEDSRLTGVLKSRTYRCR